MIAGQNHDKNADHPHECTNVWSENRYILTTLHEQAKSAHKGEMRICFK